MDGEHFRREGMRIGGKIVGADRTGERAMSIVNPHTRQCIGTVPKATLEEIRDAFAKAAAYRPRLTRFERANILNKAAAIVRARTSEIAALITTESGLCIKDAIYEAGRVADVLGFGANEVLKDDGQIFSCDLTPHGKKRRVFTQRDPLLGVISAITPFNQNLATATQRVFTRGIICLSLGVTMNRYGRLISISLLPRGTFASQLRLLQPPPLPRRPKNL